MSDLLDRLISWARHQPVIAKFVADALMVGAVAALHRWGIEVPAEVRTAIDAATILAIGGTTAATWKSVKPTVKLPASDPDSTSPLAEAVREVG